MPSCSFLSPGNRPWRLFRAVDKDDRTALLLIINSLPSMSVLSGWPCLFLTLISSKGILPQVAGLVAFVAFSRASSSLLNVYLYSQSSISRGETYSSAFAQDTVALFDGKSVHVMT